MKFSILTLCYGRISHLEEAIASVVGQDWPRDDFEMVIVNSCPNQVLHCSLPYVRILNLKDRPNSLGECRNIGIEAAQGKYILILDDDDIAFPNHLKNFARGFTDNHEWCWLSHQFYSEDNVIRKIVPGTFNVAAFSKEAWRLVGGYDAKNVGEDRHFIGKITARFPGVKLPLLPQDVSSIYRWGDNSFHISGLGDDKPGRVSSWERARLDLEGKIKRGIVPTGDVQLSPKWRHDYRALMEQFLSSHNLIGDSKLPGLGVVLLGKFGDIINNLPILKRLADAGRNPHVIVAREFASIFDGVSYVKPLPVDLRFDQLDEAVMFAQSRFNEVLRLQLYGKGFKHDRKADTYNMEPWVAAGMLEDFTNPQMIPVFDRRDANREQAVVRKIFVKPGMPKIVTCLVNAQSSPFQRGPFVVASIKQAFKKTHEVVDVSSLKLHRIYDLLGIIEKADLFICADTAPLHLAAATKTPTIALVNDNPWLATMPRGNTIARIRYGEANSKRVIAEMERCLGRPVVVPTHRGHGRNVVVRRMNSIGDVLMASSVVKALNEMGVSASLQCNPALYPIMKRTGIALDQHMTRAPEVNLDGAYESHPQRRSRHTVELFYEKANTDLRRHGIKLPDRPINFGAVVTPLYDYKARANPTVVICPRSNSFPGRTILDSTWKHIASMVNASCVWAGNHGPAPEGIRDGNCNTLDDLCNVISEADLVVSVDTGPMHIAAAYRKPLVTILQASHPVLHLSGQRDFVVIDAKPDLSCLNCQQDVCDINANLPPCQDVNAERIAGFINRRLASIIGDSVSAIIPVYKPDPNKLNRCLECVLPQVEEVVIVGDLDTPQTSLVSAFAKHPKVSVVCMNDRKTGYGRKATFGARHSNGRFLHFLNDDVYLNPDVIVNLRETMIGNQTLGIVTHLLRYLDGTIQYAGKHRDRGAYGFGHTDLKKKGSRHKGVVFQESACGASMMVRRNAFFRVDGFDEGYVLYSEDDDLAMSIRKAGYSVLFTPEVEGLHEEHCSTSITPGGLTTLLAESSARFAKKWKHYFDRNPNPNIIGKF